MWIESFSEQSFINFDKVISINMMTDQPNSERITVTTDDPNKEEIEIIAIAKARAIIMASPFSDEEKKKIHGANVILKAFLSMLIECLKQDGGIISLLQENILKRCFSINYLNRLNKNQDKLQCRIINGPAQGIYTEDPSLFLFIRR